MNYNEGNYVYKIKFSSINFGIYLRIYFVRYLNFLGILIVCILRIIEKIVR